MTNEKTNTVKTIVKDGWTNILTGLGIKGKDKRVSAQVSWERQIETDLDHAYAGDAIARKIVELPVDECFKKGYKLTGLEPDQVKKVTEAGRVLRVDDHCKDAFVKARQYGGSGVVLVTDGIKNPEQPMTDKEKLRAMNVLGRFELFVSSELIQRDILKPNYGKPEYYQLQPTIGNSTVDGQTATTTKIHASRIIRFDGLKLPKRLKIENSYWEDSVLTALTNSIRNYQTSHDSSASILQDFSVGVFKIKNLADQVASNGDEAVIARMHIVNMTKSIAKAIVVDADQEDFNYSTRTVSGVGELIQKAADHLVTESNMPHTVLFGSSPSGMGGTGNHEMDNWYNYVKTEQNDNLKPKLLQIYKLICFDLGIDSSKLDVEFNSLYELDDKEQAEVNKIQAEADTLNIQNQIYDSEEARDSRYGSGKFNLSTTLIKESTKPFGDPSLEPEIGSEHSSVQASALNGAQVASMVQVVTAVGMGAMPKESAIEIMKRAFSMEEAEAKKIIDPIVPGSIKPEVPNTNPTIGA